MISSPAEDLSSKRNQPAPPSAIDAWLDAGSRAETPGMVAASRDDTPLPSGCSDDERSSCSPVTDRGVQPKPTQARKPGHWNAEEHERFVEGLNKYNLTNGLGRGGAELMSKWIGTRSAMQVRSHAQKYFGPLQARKDTVSESAECEE
eukprot:1278693-Rhodomonas_salina.1